jgi:AraC-like DNA-binding protein
MDSRVDSWRQTLFDGLLRGIRLRCTLTFRPDLRAPWGVRIVRDGAVFHIIVRGICWFEMKDLAQPVRLSAGDFVIVTRGGTHTLRNPPSSRVVDFFDLAKRHGYDERRIFRAGGKGALTRFISGEIRFENERSNPLLAILPPLLRVKATGAGARQWIRLTAGHMLQELDSGGAGAMEVVTRLADILFIHAVRAYFEENADSARAGWLRAVRDEQIGKGLALLHSHPHEPWTVSSLARRLGASRSAFAAKFNELVGEPPLRYLTRLRINVAAVRLSSSEDKLSAVASAAGYESVPSFVRSFKRHMGETPGKFRARSGSNRPA